MGSGCVPISLSLCKLIKLPWIADRSCCPVAKMVRFSLGFDLDTWIRVLFLFEVVAQIRSAHRLARLCKKPNFREMMGQDH